jgi:hypothetical protein
MWDTHDWNKAWKTIRDLRIKAQRKECEEWMKTDSGKKFANEMNRYYKTECSDWL